MPRPHLTLADRLPRSLGTSGLFPANWLLLERDLRPTRHGKLWAKLAILNTRTHLRKAWKAVVGSDLGTRCGGAVNGCATEWLQPHDGSRRLEADRRYFALCMLAKRSISVEVISHEAVHLGFCYAKRVEREIFKASGSFDEERIAYPAGRLAAAINHAIWEAGLWT